MNRNVLGKRIREERKKQKLTQEQLAEKINVSTAYIGYIERGERSLSLKKLILLAEVLGVPADYLLADSSSPSSREKLLLTMFSSATEEQQQLILELTQLILKHSSET